MKKINVSHLIDQGKFNSFYSWTFMICLLIIILDGYDLNIFGVVLPVLMKETGLGPAQAGLLASYTLTGMIAGSIIFGMLADKIGRKKVIILSTVFYSIFTGLTGTADGLTDFAVYRFLGGMGLAGVTPNVLALISEYSPLSRRATLVGVTNVGVPIGTILCTLIGMLLLADYGWRLMFLLSFVALILIPLSMKILPESMVYLIRTGKKDKISAILNKVDPSFNSEQDHEYEVNSFNKKGSASPLSLFRDGFARNTVLFCLMFFINLYAIFGVGTWLPKMMTQQGYTLGSSLWFLLCFNLGSFVFVPIGGKIADRHGFKVILITYYLLASVFTLILSVKMNIIAVSLTLFIVGGAVNAIQSLLYAYVGQNYPLTFRSTALGWIVSVGRLGGAVGPTVQGILLGMGVPLTVNFLTFAIPPAVAAIAVYLSKNNIPQAVKGEDIIVPEGKAM